MDTALIIALASLLSAIGAVCAALVAVFALRAQHRMQFKQHNLDNYWRVTEGWWALRADRALAAHSLIHGDPDDNRVILVLNYLERLAHLVRAGELERGSAMHAMGISAVVWWNAAGDLIGRLRSEAGSNGPFEDLEWLQNELNIPLPREAWIPHLERQARDLPAPFLVALERDSEAVADVAHGNVEIRGTSPATSEPSGPPGPVLPAPQPTPAVPSTPWPR